MHTSARHACMHASETYIPALGEGMPGLRCVGIPMGMGRWVLPIRWMGLLEPQTCCCSSIAQRYVDGGEKRVVTERSSGKETSVHQLLACTCIDDDAFARLRYVYQSEPTRMYRDHCCAHFLRAPTGQKPTAHTLDSCLLHKHHRHKHGCIRLQADTASAHDRALPST